MRSWGSEHLFSLKIDNFQHHDEQGQSDDRPVAVLPAQLGHVGKIHAVPPGEKGEGEKEGGDHGENGHDLVLAGVQLGLIELPELEGIFAQQMHIVVEAARPAGEALPAAGGGAGEGLTLLRAEGVSDVGERLVVGMELGELSAETDEGLLKPVGRAVEQLFLQRIHFFLQVLKVEHVLFHHGFKKKEQQLAGGEGP